jgi:hypothetical protein
MLGYLDSLCAALLARDRGGIIGLLRHPLARALPRKVREESLAIARAGPRSLRAPIHTLHYYHQSTFLLGARGDARDPAAVQRDGAAQLEMALAAARRGESDEQPSTRRLAASGD